MKEHKFTAIPTEYLSALNETLPKCSAIGAYCTGVVTAIVQQRTSVFPSKVQIQAAAMCTSVSNAVELALMFVSEIKRRGPSRRNLN